MSPRIFLPTKVYVLETSKRHLGRVRFTNVTISEEKGWREKNFECSIPQTKGSHQWGTMPVERKWKEDWETRKLEVKDKGQNSMEWAVSSHWLVPGMISCIPGTCKYDRARTEPCPAKLCHQQRPPYICSATEPGQPRDREMAVVVFWSPATRVSSGFLDSANNLSDILWEIG